MIMQKFLDYPFLLLVCLGLHKKEHIYYKINYFYFLEQNISPFLMGGLNKKSALNQYSNYNTIDLIFIALLPIIRFIVIL
jgi:hypothetical protein